MAVDINSVIHIAREAGAAIMSIYDDESQYNIQHKADSSPVTQADLLANDVVVNALQMLTPDIPIISEEANAPPFVTRSTWSRYWLIDPLDGTKEFIEHTGQFTVNIALIDGDQPILGIVYLPALDVCYFGAVDQGAHKQVANESPEAISTRTWSKGNTTVTISKRQSLEKVADMLAPIGYAKVEYAGSAVKICYVAEGKADVYLRLGDTSEWDTAAGHCILQAAGGLMVDLGGQPLQYNAKDSLINPEFIAAGDRQLLTTLEILK